MTEGEQNFNAAIQVNISTTALSPGLTLDRRSSDVWPTCPVLSVWLKQSILKCNGSQDLKVACLVLFPGLQIFRESHEIDVCLMHSLIDTLAKLMEIS